MKFTNFITGTATLIEWFGKDLEPVPNALAVKRAMICVDCPLNKKAKWHQKWPGYFQTLSGLRNTLRANGCQTPLDPQLHTCSGCDCPLSIKIHCPIDVIRNHMPDATMEQLHKDCWIIHE